MTMSFVVLARFLHAVFLAGDFFYCPDGRPIPIEFLCDGTDDCQDEKHSDELNCDAADAGELGGSS